MKDNTETTTKLTKAVEKNISSSVLAKINVLHQAGEMRLPKDYSAENALKSAYLILVETKNKQNQFALQHCTQESIANALLKMVVLGLSPMKKQCNLIMYGNKLSCDVEYTGNIILAKRYGGLQWINPVTIFEGDKFEFAIDIETGRKRVTKHEQTLKNLGTKKVAGAYAVYKLADGSINTEIMEIEQIKQSWGQGAMKGASPAHKNFPDQMANKTVINRACKLLIRGSDDNVLFYPGSDFNKDRALADKEHDINKNANKEEITIDVDNVEVDVVVVDGKEITINTGETAEEYSERVKGLEGYVEKIKEQAQQTTGNDNEKTKKTPKLDVKPVREPIVDEGGQTQIDDSPNTELKPRGPGF